MAKQANDEGSFDKVFLEYLRLRFEFEPLPHYVMVAMHVCHEAGHDYPAFVRSFFTWFADSFLFNLQGEFPAQGHRGDRTDARWRRYEDCHDLLTGWLSGDLDAALDRHEARIVLVEYFEEMRKEVRDDGSASKRARSEMKLDGVIFEELAEQRGEEAQTLFRRFKKLAKPKKFMVATTPIALVRGKSGFVIETRKIGREGEINLKPTKLR